MNEQEYEKSIAEPWLVTTGSAHHYKAEREFSRGAWKHLKALRDILYLSKEVLGAGPGVIAPVVPIPDVRPPEPRDTGAFITTHAALAKVGPLTKAVADEIIREVRARTVK